jgi:hypothetical protein
MIQWLSTIGGAIAMLLTALLFGERLESGAVPISGEFPRQVPTSTVSLDIPDWDVALVLPAVTTSTTTTTVPPTTVAALVPVVSSTTEVPVVVVVTTTTTLYPVFEPLIDVPVERARTRRVEVESVQEMVRRIFPEKDHVWALRVMACESSNDPSALNTWSKTMGLFQHHPRYWDDRSALAGIPGADPFDAESNITVAEWLLNTGSRDHPRGSWHWECK